MTAGTRLLIISFDAVGDHVLDRLGARPNTGAFLRSATTARDVRSVFLTNTYPVHCSVVTGVPPAVHGLISNVPPFPRRHPVWNYRASGIRAKTLWQAVHEKGFSAASVLWPVTGGAREIRYNLPEIMPRPGDSQLLLNLKNGSPVMQIRLWLRYRNLLQGIRQPALDRFAVAAMADILRRHRPKLALMHLSAYDGLCHIHGEDFDRLDTALEVLDEGLGVLLDAFTGGAGDTAVILFSDHAQLNVEKNVRPNSILLEMGLLRRDAEGAYHPGGSGCFIECCGGSAFFHPGKLLEDGEGRTAMAAIRRRLEETPGFHRWLGEEEMNECGRGTLPGKSPGGLPFGFCVLPGYNCEEYGHEEKAQHGYPADYGGYRVFYAVRGRTVPRGKTLRGGSLLDIAPLALRLLGQGLPPERAPVLPDLPPAREDFFA
ncbi:MAG: ectonucleotide pyrophosphatase/phosphodiesterase [Treponema sp.]|jgi:predicted AlkP superfamily pyrophosphatase or phosphodiesterase|nr:ectonucleotide pyrophosphatase/phosphodiesterase [Treponema sp.]